MSKISVIMPAYNCCQYIKEAIASVLCQSEPDIELIVVNDGSTDDTPKIVELVMATDERVKVINQCNSGRPSIARNKGLAEASGEFVCFLDGDDLYCPEKIEQSMNVLQREPSAKMVFHDVRFIDKTGTPQPGSYLERVRFSERVLSASRKIGEITFLCDERSLFYFMCTTVTTILMSSVLICWNRLKEEPFRFPEDLTIGEDLELWFRLVRTGGIAYIDKPFSYYRLHAGSVTRRNDRNFYDPVLAHIRNYRRSHNFLNAVQRRQYRRRIAGDLYDIGYTRMQEGRRDEARRLYLESLRWRLNLGSIKGIVRASHLLNFAKGHIRR
jgi:glycosyltransferase involved in cell wall biosynthesis